MANKMGIKIPKPGFGGILNGGFVAIDAVANMSEGNGVVKSIAKAGVDFAINDAVMGFLGGPASIALMGAQIGGTAVDAGLAIGRDKVNKTMHNTTGLGKVGGAYNDNQYAATMRQRSLQAIGGSQGMTRNAFGNEARRRASSISY